MAARECSRARARNIEFGRDDALSIDRSATHASAPHLALKRAQLPQLTATHVGTFVREMQNVVSLSPRRGTPRRCPAARPDAGGRSVSSLKVNYFAILAPGEPSEACLVQCTAVVVADVRHDAWLRVPNQPLISGHVVFYSRRV
jgi:hypothetical protein